MTMPAAAVPFSSSVQFFGQQQPPYNLDTVQVTQQEFSHDVAVMSFWADDVDSDSYQSGMPMALTWGRPLVKRSFYGYVNHVSRSNNALGGSMDRMTRNSTTVVCVGASWPMKEAGTLTFRNQTASQVVAQIAQLFGLATNIVPDTTTWPVLHMAGMTYWEFCVMLAQRIGYTFYCSGVTLFFKPRQTDTKQIAGLVAYYDYRSDPGSLPVFMPTLGAANPLGGELANRTVTGIDTRTSQVISATVSGNPAPNILGSQEDAPVFDRIEHMTVRNQSEAYIKLAGVGRSNQLYLTAAAHGAGDPLVAQGSLVFVANANGSQNGLWFVTKCVQEMGGQHYTMNLSLGRDSRGATVQATGVSSAASQQKVSLVSSTWVAA